LIDLIVRDQQRIVSLSIRRTQIAEARVSVKNKRVVQGTAQDGDKIGAVSCSIGANWVWMSMQGSTTGTPALPETGMYSKIHG
jgi:hypothetical protein